MFSVPTTHHVLQFFLPCYHLCLNTTKIRVQAHQEVCYIIPEEALPTSNFPQPQIHFKRITNK